MTKARVSSQGPPSHEEPVLRALGPGWSSLGGPMGPLRAGLDAVARHGDYPRWRAAVDAIPNAIATHFDLRQPVIELGREVDFDAATRQRIETSLLALCPWRKGPFRVVGTLIDAEWRSDQKWGRLEPWLTSLAGRRVLDVGSGNGYYCLRALGAGASLVLGIDPSPLAVLQFASLCRLLPPIPAWVLPLTLEQFAPLEPIASEHGAQTLFDTVFSMGVLYHRREPEAHLRRLHQLLRPGGELVLETLVVENEARALYPRGRYANMRNVFVIPSLPVLGRWLTQAGFERVRSVDVTRTTPMEQRSTRFMPFHSLQESLDPADTGRTLEGYPAPTRAIVLATSRAKTTAG